MCILSYKPCNLAIVRIVVRHKRHYRTWYPSGATKTHLGVVEQHFTDTILNASFTIMFQTDLYLPVANRYITYLIHRNETAKWVSFQYKSLPTHTNTQRRPKEQMLHWLMDIYKMFISFFSPSQSFPVFVLLSDCMAVLEDGHWFLSACLSISAPLLYPSVEEHREGALPEIIPQLCLSGQMERGLFLTEHSGWVEYQCPALVGQTPLKWCPSISCDIFTQNGPIPDVIVWNNRI